MKKINNIIKNISINKIMLIMALLLTNLKVFAQTNFNDDVNDGVPIDDYYWVLALVGLIFAVIKLRSIQNKNIIKN
jgi:hypothetical protein